MSRSYKFKEDLGKILNFEKATVHWFTGWWLNCSHIQPPKTFLFFLLHLWGYFMYHHTHMYLCLYSGLLLVENPYLFPHWKLKFYCVYDFHSWLQTRKTCLFQWHITHIADMQYMYKIALPPPYPETTSITDSIFWPIPFLFILFSFFSFFSFKWY